MLALSLFRTIGWSAASVTRRALPPVTAVLRALAHRREVTRLLAADDRLLKDIGLTRSEVAGVLDGPLFRDPSILLARSVEWRRRGRPLVTAPPVQKAPARRVVPVVRGDFAASLRAGR
jgi:uncharacterized protein YjiS (DUF1127 family)